MSEESSFAMGVRVRIRVGQYEDRRGHIVERPEKLGMNERGYFVSLDGTLEKVGPYTWLELAEQKFG